VIATVAMPMGIITAVDFSKECAETRIPQNHRDRKRVL
jgi:hypothetical protein